MERVQFKVVINAPKEKVWKTLWEDETYRKWTSVFSPSSHAESDWKEGSKILFVDGTGHGMVSYIETNKPFEKMSFKHAGEIKDGIEDVESEKVKPWAGAMEIYTLIETDGKTDLLVELDLAEEYKAMFMAKFPKALDKVKELAEAND